MNLKLIKNTALLAIVPLLLSLSLLSVNAIESNSDVCSNFTGASTPLTAANINEGQLDFNNTTVQNSVKGCANMQSVYGQDHYVLKGWVWNTNLGWISLGSFANEKVNNKSDLVEFPSGVASISNKVNRGISSGTRAYSSVANITTRFADGTPDSGELEGYWWGDNVGWIRLNCEPYYTTDANICGTSNFKVQFNGGGKFSGYGWSDTVGWINMSSVSMDFKPVTLLMNDIEVTLSTQTNDVIADGKSGHKMRVTFARSGANITEQFFNYMKTVNADAVSANDVKFCVLAQDNRVLDDTVEVSTTSLSIDNCQSSNIRFATNLQDFILGPGKMSNYALVNGGLESVQTLKSLVPTKSGEFLLDKFSITVGTDTFSKAFAAPLDLIYDVPFDLSLVVDGDVLGSEECSLSENNVFRLGLSQAVGLSLCGDFYPIEGVSRLNPKIRMNYIAEPNENLLYYFFTAINTLTNKPVSSSAFDDYLIDLKDRFNNADTSVGLQSLPFKTGNSEKFKGKLPLAGQGGFSGTSLGDLLSGMSTAEQSETGVKITNYAPKGNNPLVLTPSIGSGGYMSDAFRVVADPVEGFAGDYSELENEVNTFGVSSVVEYNISSNVVVKRTRPSLNQSYFRIDQLSASGGFDDRAFTQIGGGSSGSSGGSKNLIRDRFIKSVFELLGGKVEANCTVTPNSQNRFTALSLAKVKGCKPSAQREVYYVANNSENRAVINYNQVKGLFTGTDDSAKTLVLVGFDVVFNENVVDEDKLFSMVLFTNNKKKGGNVYVTSAVTDLAGYMFADRPIYSVEGLTIVTGTNTATSPFNVSADGVPKSYNLRTSTPFYNEITFSGRYFTQNCVGCALSNPPRKGDGSIATIDEAQPYDFNYFRFSSLLVRTGVDEYEDTVFLDCDGNPTFALYNASQADDYLCWAPRAGVLESSLMSAKRAGQTNLKPKDRRAINFLYRSPAGIPLFEGL
jgi:hypothetical protein